MKISDVPTLVLIDGHAHLFQAYHGISSLNDPNGRPVNAIFGVTNIMFRMLEKFPCTHLAFCFDSPGPTFRHEMDPEYKANRGEMDPELKEQIPRLHELLDDMNIPWIAMPGYECDDLVGTLSKQGDEAGLKVIMISDDKDFGQLINDNVLQYKNRKDVIMDAKRHEQDMGVRPNQLIDYLALVGDSSDNVSGVPGVGPKTAVTLLAEYDQADAIWDNLDDLKGKRRENIENNRAAFELSRDLVTIKRDVEIELSVDDLIRKPWDADRLADRLRGLGFKRFLNRLDLGSAGTAPAVPDIKRRYEGIYDERGLISLIRRLGSQKIIAIDTETTGLDPHRDRVVGLSFSWGEGRAAYVVIESPEGGVDRASAVDLLKPLLERDDITWVGHNLKFDAAMLAEEGLQLGSSWEDTMLMSFNLDSANRRLKLDDLISDRLGIRMIPLEDVLGKGRSKITMDQAPRQQVVAYGAEDADMTLRLWHKLQEGLEADDNRLIHYRTRELPILRCLLKMECHGVRLDSGRLKTLSDTAATELADIEKAIHNSVGHEFNIASPKQLGTVLFEELGLPVVKKTKTGYSTDSKVLAKLSGLHEVPKMVEEFRQLAKLKNTYLDALPEFTDDDGIVHTTFSLTAAATGRLASNNPNLQNIPIRNPRGREIRGAFFPRRHDAFLAADYSQIELRLMAHFSEDPELQKAFAEGLDIHRFVAAELAGCTPEDVSDDERAKAKAVNFGILYGQGAFGLSEQLGIEQREAKAFIESYFERFATIRDFIDQTVESARECGYVETLSGHQRPIPELASSNKMLQRMGERVAVNTLMQGSAADLIKEAMLRVDSWLTQKHPDIAMVLQIHDELIFDLPASECEAFAADIQPLMTNDFPLNVPLEISVHWGPSWLEAK